MSETAEFVKSLGWRCDIIGCTCDWSRVSSGGRYFWFKFRLSKLVGFRCMGSSVRVHVCVCVRFGSIFDDSREMFVGWHRAVCPAKQRVGNVDSKIGVELWWTSYQFIHVSLGCVLEPGQRLWCLKLKHYNLDRPWELREAMRISNLAAAQLWK